MKNGFIMIPDSLFKEKMPDKARILLGIITRYSKKDEYAFASNEIYANKLKCTTRTITKLIKYLVDNNYITITNLKTDKRKIYVRNNIPIT